MAFVSSGSVGDMLQQYNRPGQENAMTTVPDKPSRLSPPSPNAHSSAPSSSRATDDDASPVNPALEGRTVCMLL